MTAVTGVAVSVGTGTVAVGSAFFLVSSASIARADLAGPKDDKDLPVEYTYTPYEVDQDDITVGNNKMAFTAGNINLTLSPNMTQVGVQAGANTHLKLTLTGAETANYTLNNLTKIQSRTLWVTGDKNSLIVGQDMLTQSISAIYVDKVGLQFKGSYQGAKELRANLVLGSSSYTSGTGTALDGSTLIIGSSESANVITVSTTGSLTVEEDAKIGFYTPGSSLTVKGALTGEGSLTLDSHSSGAGLLYLLGGSEDYKGVINMGTQATRLYLGKDTELGGLAGGTEGTHIGVSGVTSLTLTLNTNGRNLSFDGTSSGNVENWASGIYVRKIGDGTQSLKDFSGSGAEVSRGTLKLTGGQTVVGSRGVIVNGGVSYMEVEGPTDDDTSVTFTGGKVSVRNGGHLTMRGNVSLSAATLEMTTGKSIVSYVGGTGGTLTLGNVTLNNDAAELHLSGNVDLSNANLTLAAGELTFGESGATTLTGLSSSLVISGAKVTFSGDTTIDMSNFAAGKMSVDVDGQKFSYLVDVVKVTGNGSVVGWNNVKFTGGFTSQVNNGVFAAGVNYDNAYIVQNRSLINWLPGQPVDGAPLWEDTKVGGKLTRLAVIKPGSVVMVTGEDTYRSTVAASPTDAKYLRRVEDIFVAEGTELALRQSCYTYANGSALTESRLGSVGWRHMLLLGDLVLQNVGVLAIGDNYFINTIDYSPSARVIIDWVANSINGYASGTGSSLPRGYHGNLVVRSGIYSFTAAESYSQVTVENGGELELMQGTHGFTPLRLTGTGLAYYADVINGSRNALQTYGNVTYQGTVTIADYATINSFNSVATFTGDFLGEGQGLLTFNNGRMILEGKVQGIKKFTLENDAVIEIRSEYDAANIDEATVASQRFNHLAGTGTLRFTNTLTGFNRITTPAGTTIEITRDTDSFGSGVIDFTKDGAGKLVMHRNFDMSGKLTISSGSLYFGNSADCNYRLGASDIDVLNASMLILNHAPGNFNANLTLNGGVIKNTNGWGSEGVFRFRTLTLAGGASEIQWANNGSEGFSFEKLTGNGDLHLDDMTGGGEVSQIFHVDEVVNFNGTVFSGGMFANAARLKKVEIGTVHQDPGSSGAISMDDEVGRDVYASSQGFRKTGAGEFSINRIRFENEVWMNYEGTLKLGEVMFTDNAILHYTSGDNNKVILSEGVEDLAEVQRLYIDVLDLDAAALRNGVNLGFYSNIVDISTITRKLVVGGLDDYELRTQDGRLYLFSNKAVDLDWDRAMGVVSMAWAPTKTTLNNASYAGETETGNWLDDMKVLGEHSRFQSTKNNQITTVVKLHSSGHNYTIVGALKDKGLRTQSYLYMVGGSYNMLIGGSVFTRMPQNGETAYVEGGTHIQVEDGNVNYIVGGNHLSWDTAYLLGDTYVSFRGGNLKGGIVGGNTYGGNGGDFGSSTKRGSTNIFIYTSLYNSANTPAIGVLDDYTDSAKPFTMVVGGSAYVGDGFGNKQGINHYGDSKIVVNLGSYTETAAFGKGIVGGNAYLTKNGWKVNSGNVNVPDSWDTSFVGDSSITINGANSKGANITFNGIVAGATYHNVAGDQKVKFTGDTTVSVRGGRFAQNAAPIAGGFHFGKDSIGNHQATLSGDTSVTLYGGSFWRVVGGSYSLGTGEGNSFVNHDGNTQLEIMGGTFTATAPADAAKVDPETWRSFVAGGSYLTGNRSATPHEHNGSAKLLISGGTFTSTLVVGGDFLSTTLPTGMSEIPNVTSLTRSGTYLDISGAKITDALVVGGGYLADTGENGSVLVAGGSHLTIGEGAVIEASADSAQHGIAATAGSYLNVSGDGHAAEITGGASLSMTGGTVTGHLVGGSVMTGYANDLTTDIVNISLSGGTVKGSIYGGHYVGNVAVSPSVSADTNVDSVSIEVTGSAITGNIYGGGSFSCGEGYGSSEYVQTQGDIVVSLQKGSLTGNVYAAGELGRPALIRQPNEDPVQPKGARVETASTRVELASAFNFGAAKSIVSGDYRLADANFTDYLGNISGSRTLAFTDSGDYSKIKNWAGVSFVDFDIVEVADNANVKLSKTQFTAEATGLVKTGAGTLELEGALPNKATISVYGGILKLGAKQKLDGGIHFDLTGRPLNTADTALLQGLNGFADGNVDVFLDGDLDSYLYGKYYLVSGWNAATMQGVQRWANTDTREFLLLEEGNNLVLNVREKSSYKWLWRGATGKDARVGDYEWDPKSPVNWNAHEMDRNSVETPEGKDVLFTASVGGDVLVGELVQPSSVTVSSGNYVFKQRSADVSANSGIWTNRLTVGGSVQEAVLDLQLSNRNINNIFLESNGTLILSNAAAIVSSLDRPTYNSLIYFNGGRLFFEEEFTKDISWQVSEASSDMVRIGIAANHVEDDRIVWGKLHDSESMDTWSYNPGLVQAYSVGIEKTGEGTLRILSGDKGQGLAITGDVQVREGMLEMLFSANTNLSGTTLTQTGELGVSEGATYVVSLQRGQSFRLSSDLTGDGEVVLGRLLGEDADYKEESKAKEKNGLTDACGLQGHGGVLRLNAYANFILSGDNRDFSGTLVLEGTGEREGYSYVRIGHRVGSDPVSKAVLHGYDPETQTLTALGGSRTTLVLAGRHITVDGIITESTHPDYSVDPNLVKGVANTSNVGEDKFVRAGVVEVREGTLNYIGGTARDSETDNTHVHATSYRPWDDAFIFTGKLTGSGTLATVWGFKPDSADGNNTTYGGYYGHELRGAISEFDGWLVAGDLQSKRDEKETGTEWTLFASSATDKPGERSIINAKLAGGGTFIFMYTQDTVLAGSVGDARELSYGNNPTLINEGEGAIIIGSDRNTSKGLLYSKGGGFELGDVDHYARWVGTDLRGDSTFTLVNGELGSPMQLREGSTVLIRVETSALGGTRVDAGGTKAEDLYEVIINKDGFLTGVFDDIVASRDATNVKLVFSKANVTSTATTGVGMIELRYNRNLIVEDPNYFLMDFGVDSIVDLLKQTASAQQAEAYLHVLSKGNLVIDKNLWTSLMADGGAGARLLAQLGLYIERIEGGNIVMKATGGHRAYTVFSNPTATDSHLVNQYGILSEYDAVILEQGQTLQIHLQGEPTFGRDAEAGGAVVPNLWGSRDSTVSVRNTNYKMNDVLIIFDNSNPYKDGLDSIFEGTIDGGEHVNFKKTGAGSLTIGYHSSLTTSGGFNGDSLEIEQGAVILQGVSNEVRGTLSFSYDKDTDESARGLTLLNGKTSVGNLVEKGAYGGPIVMGGNSSLTIKLDTMPDEEGNAAKTVWNDTVVMRESKQSTGSMTVQGGELHLTNADKAQLQGVHLGLTKNAYMSLNCLEEASVASLGGNGTLRANVEGTLEVTNEGDATFNGTLESADGVENTLHVAKHVGTMTIRNVKNLGNWSLNNDGNMVIDVSGKNSPASANNNMSFNKLTLGKESMTTYYINSDHVADYELSEMLTANSLTVESGATLTVDSNGNLLYTGPELIIAKVGAGSSANGLSMELVGFSFMLNKVEDRYVDMDGNLKLVLGEVTENSFLQPNMEANARAGANLFWDAVSNKDSRWRSQPIEQWQDLRDMLDGLDRLQKAGNYAALNSALAAGAGAATAVMGPAFAQDLQRQLQAVRNRTTMMSASQNYVDGGERKFHAWINAEGNYHQQDADGLAAGFKLNSWGGTVGMDVDTSERTTMGLALTAMYGDLDAKSQDRATGKMDTYYLNFFGKTSRGRWMHTVVGSIGMASISMNRTVDYTLGSYSTSGSTNGYAFGVMYEVGYSLPMGDDASYVIQPVANLTLRHVGISGYQESGRGAQLRVGDVSQTIMTLGAGVRAQAVIGENMYNRTSILEGRLLVKLDAGDRKGSSKTGLVNGSNLMVPMVAAETGAIGIEMGVGVTIPLENTSGSIFIDGSAELRAGYSNLNATVGYRLDF